MIIKLEINLGVYDKNLSTDHEVKFENKSLALLVISHEDNMFGRCFFV